MCVVCVSFVVFVCVCVEFVVCLCVFVCIFFLDIYVCVWCV